MDHIPERHWIVNAGLFKHNDPVEVIGHDDEGIEGYSRVAFRKLAPDPGYHVPSWAQLHSVRDNTAEQRAPVLGSHRNEVRT